MLCKSAINLDAEGDSLWRIVFVKVALKCSTGGCTVHAATQRISFWQNMVCKI